MNPNHWQQHHEDHSMILDARHQEVCYLSPDRDATKVVAEHNRLVDDRDAAERALAAGVLAPSAPKLDAGAISHFVKCARQGRNPASSGAEKLARKIAVFFFKIGDEICRLDGHAVRGLGDLLRAMNGPWDTEAQQDAVYQALTNAGGGR